MVTSQVSSGAHPVPERKPVSDRKLAANRANALKSTGPRTAKGKARSRLNATRHGLRASLPPEQTPDIARVLKAKTYAHRKVHEAFVAELRPASKRQRVLVERLARAAWLIGRAESLDAALCRLGRYVVRLDGSLNAAMQQFRKARQEEPRAATPAAGQSHRFRPRADEATAPGGPPAGTDAGDCG